MSLNLYYCINDCFFGVSETKEEETHSLPDLKVEDTMKLKKKSAKYSSVETADHGNMESAVPVEQARGLIPRCGCIAGPRYPNILECNINS